MIRIIPAINVQSETEFVSALKAVETAVPLVQIDVADGTFTQWSNWHVPDVIAQLSTPVKFELHLMVKDPQREMEQWKQVPNVTRVILHKETLSPSFPKFMSQLSAHDYEIGLAINPATPAEEIEEYLDLLSCILCLGVQPGSSGQVFDQTVLQKITYLRKNYHDLDIEVDGGVTLTNAKEIVRAGANILCASSAIFTGPHTPTDNLKHLLAATH